VIILSAYACFWLFSLYSIDPYLSLLIILPASLILGRGFYEVLFRKVAGAKITSLLIAFGLMALMEHLMTVLWTANTRAVRTSYTAYGIKVLGLNISFTRLIAFLIALCSVACVAFFLKRTLLGKAVRAASKDLEAATLVGISPHAVNGITFAIGIALAAVAGVATATTYPFDPYFGFIFSLKAMIALALGGLGSIGGAFFGGIYSASLRAWPFYQRRMVMRCRMAYFACLDVRPRPLCPHSRRHSAKNRNRKLRYCSWHCDVLGLPFILDRGLTIYLFFHSPYSPQPVVEYHCGYTGRSHGHHAFFVSART
jgi:branched-chain amino acid transport system permease protein